MANTGSPRAERELGAPDAIAATLRPAELVRLAELVYRLLRDDVMRAQERRGEAPARWR